MPANSMLGQRKVTRQVYALASFVWDRAVTYADVRDVPGGGTVLQLPDEADGGDEYEWTNPDNSCGPGNVITLGLSAAAIAAGVTIQGGASVALTSPGTCGKLVFFSPGAVWQVELYTQGGASPTGGEGGELVWRGGATPSPGIVATGAQVKAAIAASPVPLTVFVDSSAAPCAFLAAQGSVDCKGTTTFASYNAGLNNGSPADVMTVDDGAQLHRARAFTDGLNVQFQCVTATGMTFDTTPAGLSDVFSVLNRAEVNLLGGAANPVVLVPAAGELSLITDQEPTLNTGAAAPVFQLAAGALLNWTATAQVTLGGNVFAGAGGTTIDFSHDDTIPRPDFAGFGFAGTVTETRISQAAWALPSSGSTAGRPAAPDVQTGQLYYDTTVPGLFVWNGAAWVAVGGASAPVDLYPYVEVIGATPANFTQQGPSFMENTGGVSFIPLVTGSIITGVRLYWDISASGPIPLTCSLWRGGTQLATGTATPGASGLVTIPFAVPYTVLATDIGGNAGQFVISQFAPWAGGGATTHADVWSNILAVPFGKTVPILASPLFFYGNGALGANTLASVFGLTKTGPEGQPTTVGAFEAFVMAPVFQ